MPELPEFPRRNAAGSRSPARRSPSPRVEATPDVRLEDYLDHLCAPLVGRVAYARRQEMRAEWRAHLDALVEAYVELGSTPDEAVTQALRQFGDARDLGRQWARSWKRKRVQPQSIRSPLLAALGVFSAASALSAALLGAPIGLPFDPSSLLLPLLGFVLPASAGLLTGWLARGRHAMGTFYALSLLIPLTAASGHTSAVDVAAALGAAQLFCWMPIGCTAAMLGGWLREQQGEKCPGGFALEP
jgi:hypothetical protein